MGARALPGTDDAEHLEPGLLRGGPGREELADRRIQTLFGNPRFHQVVVDLTQRHGRYDGIGLRIVALDEEDALGRGDQRMSLHQEVDPGHRGHPLVRYEKGDGLGTRGQRLQRGEPLGGRPLT